VTCVMLRRDQRRRDGRSGQRRLREEPATGSPRGEVTAAAEKRESRGSESASPGSSLCHLYHLNGHSIFLPGISFWRMPLSTWICAAPLRHRGFAAKLSEQLAHRRNLLRVGAIADVLAREPSRAADVPAAHREQQRLQFIPVASQQRWHAAALAFLSPEGTKLADTTDRSALALSGRRPRSPLPFFVLGERERGGEGLL